MTDDKYWLTMELAEDSIRNSAVGSPATGTAFVSGPHTLIFVGDTVHLKVVAFDPWGRELKYRLNLGFLGGGLSEWQEAPEFEWTALSPARQADLRVEVKALGEPHSRPGQPYDSFADFRYEVRIRTNSP